MNSLDTVKERGSAEGRDSSEHSYTLTDIKIEKEPSGKAESPFASSSVQRDVFEVSPPQKSLPSPRTLREAFGDYRARMSRPPRPSNDTPRPSIEAQRKSLGARASSMLKAESIPPGVDPGVFVANQALNRQASDRTNMRISLDLGPHRLSSLDNARVEGRLIKRRRRLPVPLVLFFGIVATYAALVASCTLGIGIYNLTKLRAGRAARTVEDLRNELEPQIKELLDLMRGFIAGRQGGRK